ncbi:DEAD/DEAH box helicase [Scopulibacillus cellulosilyticus]|uniref:DEAD/DEAH box helicase n=1 Tax=Scopulibacillus cellulosilyticus TaxID=2665665 RepID=A0ABW2PWX9_9BACL
MKFSELTINNTILQAIEKMGFKEMSPIQEKAIPVALKGSDLIGQAQTGTGKTAAFGVPLTEFADPLNKAVQSIIITPTRELAIQVSEELNNIGRFKKVVTVPVYGGQDIQKQIRALKKRPSIISATPGRLLDHIKRKTIRLNEVSHVVLDEADEMLNMGFIDDIRAILEQTPQEHQTLLFSATMPKPIRLLAEQFMKNPETVKIQAKTLTVSQIEQKYLVMKERQKFDVLTRILDIHVPERAIIFGRTKRRVDELSSALQKRGYRAEGIHGDLTQARRDHVLRRFKNNNANILVATDVAARGLDISNVTHVYNFDLPQDPESYVHRIGRTGRAGKKGLAVTFVTPSEIPHLNEIEKVTKQSMEEVQPPSYEEALHGQQKAALQSIMETMESGDIENYKGLAKNLLNENDSIPVIAAALKLITKEPDTTPVKLTAESPLQVKKDRKRRPQRNQRNRGKNVRRNHHQQHGSKPYKKRVHQH